MLVNVLVTTFVGIFIAVAAFGHVLLITAIWPGLLGSRREPHLDTVVDGQGHLNQLGQVR